MFGGHDVDEVSPNKYPLQPSHSGISVRFHISKTTLTLDDLLHLHSSARILPLLCGMVLLVMAHPPLLLVPALFVARVPA